MDHTNIINQNLTLILLIIICLSFVIFGVYYSKKFQGINNYLVANRNVGTLSLTTSLVASALGTWILFGPASAATWGGIGAVIGYSLGTAFPLFILINSLSGIIGQLTKNAVFNEISNYWVLLLDVIIGGQIGNFLNLKVFPTKILALLTAVLVIFVAIRMGLKLSIFPI